MRKHQRGVTFIGWVFLLIPLAILIYVGIRVAPLYMNYFKVSRSLEQLATETRSEGQVNPVALRSSLNKRFDVEYIDHPTANEIDIHREGDGWVAVADYEDPTPLFGNVLLVVQFRKQVNLQ